MNILPYKNNKTPKCWLYESKTNCKELRFISWLFLNARIGFFVGKERGFQWMLHDCKNFSVWPALPFAAWVLYFQAFENVLVLALRHCCDPCFLVGLGSSPGRVGNSHR